MALTAIGIKNAASQGKTYKLADTDSLYLLVKPNGVKLWRMNYRHLGRQKTLAFGAWPDVTLAEARAKRDAARKQIGESIDPAEKQRLDHLSNSRLWDTTVSNAIKALP